MAVAKSYQDRKIIGEPFEKNGKKYIKIILKNGNEKEVRWYTDIEYEKMYGEKPLNCNFSAETDNTSINKVSHFGPQKDVLGFTEGFIYLLKGDQEKNLGYLQLSKARCCRWFDWYFPSWETIPEDLPADLEPVKLYWRDVGNEEGYLLTDDKVLAAVNATLYTEVTSSFVGAIGDRIDITAEVIKSIPFDNDYGHSTMHVMQDDKDRIFIWTTSAKTWSVGTKHHIKGTIKDQKIYKGEAQNILTRCIER